MRLIDADAINCNEECQNCQFARWYDFEGSCALNEQPTAYDVDKVCEELDKHSIDNTDWSYSTNPELASYYLLRTKDAIEIVRRGGIDDTR